MARTHLVWDWNGTLLNDLPLVVSSTNVAFASIDGPTLSVDEHRRAFHRPVAGFYSEVLGRPLDQDEFGRLDKIFHDAYRIGLATCELATDARSAIGSWTGTQSLLSMWFHNELVLEVERHGLTTLLARIDGLRSAIGGDLKAAYLARHLGEQGIDGTSTVLIGDSVDDADAAASVGARCVLYTGGFTDPLRLHAAGVPVADTLAEAVHLATSLP
ncbi:HAD family hydrolase [Phytohabitans rumicis]|uniref:Putative phosphatase n=1 Tax=Phytohabitans rumicis TaxID=1076125 RepID=A0A6V8L1E0_9ACTN|nr:HAD hydrolase-like protein [Phytohabitans rumicis]GFJ91093.1 putative phosphatase [Phytohabitans rumicis]